MINTLDHYICDSLPHRGDFTTNPNLEKKVDDRGNLLPFVGNTVVFLLNDETKSRLRDLQEGLYAAAPDMLAEKLQMPTFHMTLHDLANGTPDNPELPERMERTEAGAGEILRRFADRTPLRMKTTWLFNMVNTSIVLGLAPADGDTWQRLDDMYTALEAVVPLGYGLTPHITMAYFRPGTYTQEQVAALRNALTQVDMEVTLSMEDLVLQNFSDMNHYTTV